MEVKYSLNLPREAVTVPVARRMCRGAMEELGVAARCRHDVALAVTEACSNVIKHSSATDEYEVCIVLSDARCEIKVTDPGPGFDAEAVLADPPDASTEQGRGIPLMEALVDDVRFESQPHRGTVVHLVKHLDLDEDSLLRTPPPRSAA